jgi:uroporphyrin-III C-methyltransferase
MPARERPSPNSASPSRTLAVAPRGKRIETGLGDRPDNNAVKAARAAAVAPAPVVQPRRNGSDQLPCHTSILAKPEGLTTLWPLALWPLVSLWVDHMMDSKLLGLPDFETGHVWLVGAGPGDPGLLSILAFHALAGADIVVYDALVDPRILRLARPGAVLDCAGKRGGRPSPSQPDISAQLIRLARDGNRVLRLKGGDPCVFGRGGEEALALAAAGVPFRIVPGITAGIGGLAYAGIPLTHRDTNSAVTFLTGHDSDGEVPGGLDWQAIARGAPVLVLYMASRHLPSIARRLMSSGRRSAELVAVISKATTAAQRVVVSTLGEVATASAEVEAPSIVVIGEVVRFHAELDWVGALGTQRSDPPLADEPPAALREQDGR